MANHAYVSEFKSLGSDDKGKLMQAANVGYLVGTQKVTYTTSTATTNALNNSTTIIRIAVDSDAFVAFAASPTATAASMYMPSGSVEYFAVSANSGYKVAFYDGTS